MAHTPGPWKVVDRFYVWTADDVWCEVAKVCDENLDEDMLGQADADARLIAAAPDLLAALIDIIACAHISMPYGGWAYCISDDRMDAALAAINKAEGRADEE